MPTPLKTLLPLLLGALLLAALLGLAATARADLLAQETPLNPEGRVYEVNSTPGGLLWISDSGAEELWAFQPATGVYTIYDGVGRASDARQAPDGGVWWVDQLDKSLGRLAPATGAATLWKLPSDTTPFGTAIDAQGDVWLSQFFDPQVYRFHAASSELCTFTLGVSGASFYLLSDGANIWLGDWINDRIRRLDSASGQLTSWVLPYVPAQSAYPEGLAVDYHGDLWWTDSELHYLARLQPGLDRLTTYPLPFGSTPHMLTGSGRRLWYSEDQAGSLGRLDPHLALGSSTTLARTSETLAPTCATLELDWSGTLTTTNGLASWASSSYTTTVDSGGWLIHELPPEAYPWGVAAREGQVWLVDNGRQVLAQAQDSLSVAACTLADGDGNPNTTGDQTPMVGWTVQLTAGGAPVEPPQVTGPTGCAVWDNLAAEVSYGVQVQVPVGWMALGDTSHAFGALLPGEAYVHNFLNVAKVQVAACSAADADGELETTADRTPLPNQAVHLHIDGVRQEPGALTGSSGCYTWIDLDPDHSYAVEQGESAAYTNLGEAWHDFGSLPIGATAAHTFVNAASVEIAACSLSDADGDPNTLYDRSPLPGQTITLHVDSVAQAPGAVTGADGCLAWSDLAPNHSYAVEQEESAGYTLLGEAWHDFGALAPGVDRAHTFLNAASVQITACSQSDADGDLQTTDDQAPLPGQTVYLIVGGARQEPGAVTGADGCHTWDDLAPNHSYGVEQAQAAGWELLTPSIYNFGLTMPGDAFQGNFINREASGPIYEPMYLPLLLRDASSLATAP